MKPFRFPLLFIALLLTAGCSRTEAPAEEFYDDAYGEPLSLSIYGLDDAQAAAAAKTALGDLHFIEEVSHPWHPGPLGRTNQLLPLNAEFSANPSLLPLIRRATQLSEASQGYFNPALGSLYELWGLHTETIPTEPLRPSQSDIAAILADAPRMQDIHIEGIRMRGTNPSLRIDFGVFAQGYAIDTAIARLREAGTTRGRLDNDPFTVIFGDSSGESRSIHVSLTGSEPVILPLRGEEAAVHLDFPTHHFINPQTGNLLDRAVTTLVIADSAADAAAAAEALLHVPRGEEDALMQKMGINLALRARQGQPLYLSPKMAARLPDSAELEKAHGVNGK